MLPVSDNEFCISIELESHLVTFVRLVRNGATSTSTASGEAP